MATLALSVAGQFAGGLLGGPIGATIGRALGALAGNAVDAMLFGDNRDAEAPMFDVRLGGSSEGAAIPRLYGWGRLSGNIIWARELLRHATETAGAKGLFQPEGGEEEEILASFALGLCEGPVMRMGRIWADGQLLDTRGLNLRFYCGDDAQMPDSLIEAVQGPGNAPAYRGLCYLVVENLPLSRFGNRIPQLSVELCRVVGELEPAIRAVTVIPGATEFGYDPMPRLRVLAPGEGASENAHLLAGISDWTWSIDELTALCPNLEHVALVVSWFGDDLRCGACAVTPRTEGRDRSIEGAAWNVAGLGREDVPVVSQHGGGPAYGGTPSDASVRAAIADLKARGLKITLYPLLMMDVPAGNGLPDPHGASMQAAYPWRGRVTCHPAPGRPGSPDGTAAAVAQVSSFLPGYRAMILHYAGLAAAEGGVDAMLIGSEMVGLSTVRGAGDSFPFVAALSALAGDVRAIVGPGTKLTYAADWSEYSGVERDGGKFFHLDTLWASPHIDAVGIDCYMPLSDWRDGENHHDADLAASPYGLDYLEANIAGGEGFDFYYASDADRRAQIRTPITDGAHGEAWIWRYKDIRAFWSQQHFNRPGGVRAATPTAWIPGSKPIWLTELGCGAVDKGANQPNIFGDEKSAEGGRPYFSNGTPDGLTQRQFLRAHHRYWAKPANNPAGMVATDRLYCWTWDARPFPSFPALADVWSDGPNHRVGHWLTGRLGALASDEVLVAIAGEHDCPLVAEAGAPLIGGLLLSGPGSAREAMAPLLEMTGQRLAVRNGTLASLPPGGGRDVLLAHDKLAVGDGPVLSRRRGDVAERPGRLSLVHIDRERDYLAASALAIRPGSGQLTSETLPMVLDGGAARQAAERLLDRRAAHGDRLELALPPNRLELEPGDRIALPGIAEGPFEITEIRDGLTRRIVAEAVPRRDALATGTERPRAVSTVAAAAVKPLLALAHLPPSADDPLRSRLLLGAYAKPWPGTVSVADAVSGAVLGEILRPSVMGTVLAMLPIGPAALWDRGGVLDVRLGSGHLADVSELSALAGANRLAVENDNGAWEVIGFRTAELLSLGTYRLTGLLRGLEGTDAIMAPIGAGRTMVLLDGRSILLPVESHRLGESRTLRIFAGAGDAEAQVVTVTAEPGPALALPPAHLRAWRRGDGAIAMAWVRRSRADGDGWGVAEPLLEHAPESWLVHIFDGATLLRTLETTAPQALYGNAEQTMDLGGPATGFRFSVQQVSAALGPGHTAMGDFNG